MNEANTDSPAGRRTPLLARLLRALLLLVGGVALLGALTLVVLEFLVRHDDRSKGRTIEHYRLPGEKELREGLYVPHPYLGYALRPGYERAGNPNVRGVAQVHINSHGMRGPEMLVEKDPRTIRILCLGGSTTYCTGAMSDAAAWPAQLEQRLNGAGIPGVRFEVGNCGVSGWTSAESLINLALRLVELRPDFVLLYHIPNDARAIQTRGVVGDYTHLRQAWVADNPGEVDRWLSERFHLFGRWRQSRGGAEQALVSLQRYVFVPDFKSLHVRSDVEVVERGIDIYRRNLKHLIALARANGIEPLLQTFADCPSIETPDGERYTETIRRQNEVIEALGADLGVHVVDMTSLRDRPELFDDWMHYNERGCAEHGALLATKLFAWPALRERAQALDGR